MHSSSHRRFLKPHPQGKEEPSTREGQEQRWCLLLLKKRLASGTSSKWTVSPEVMLEHPGLCVLESCMAGGQVSTHLPSPRKMNQGC